MAPPATGGGTSALAKLSTPVKFLIGVALFALIGFAYWLMFYSDVSNKIEGAKNEATRLAGALTAAKSDEASYRGALDELALRSEQAKTINKVAPPEKQQAAFLSYVQNAANVAGVNLTNFVPKDEQAQTYFIRDPMQLEIVGKFHQIAKFTYEMGKQERAINLENIEITDPKLVGEELTLHGKCLATAFHTAKAKVTTPQPGQPAPPAPAPAPGGPK